MPSRQSIQLRGLQLDCHIGVPEAERSTSQRLLADLELDIRQDFSGMQDAIENTVDYAALASEVRSLAAAHPRKLIESLAAEIADHLLARYPLIQSVRVEIRKFILPETDHVAVVYQRET